MADEIRALVFDVFGTVVDWRASIARQVETLARVRGLTVDGTAIADAWRGLYQPSMSAVRDGTRPFVDLDVLHRESLDALVEQHGLGSLDDADRHALVLAWHQLDAWPDVVEGLTRLKRKFILGPLSNGHVALQVGIAKHAGLPWDVILSTDLYRTYKPRPEAYQGACKLLKLAPSQVMLVAAHNNDLGSAREQGMRTGFVVRNEHGQGQVIDQKAEQDWDVIADDFVDLAKRLGA
ncbi:haloacid dehalogenase type II [Roseiterribacter gracilis]|uniref:(S)-2-haloacid dehalogenase n=1 Tax=Roseiterribacter gracilis TaxID=2812848 RepID=A0A8S8XDI6_9PROT|nr:haloacid dehalogenase [Rhodospirillales bacterium TMPK1]